MRARVAENGGVISPNRLAHVFLPATGHEVVRAWVEGGGQPMAVGPTGALVEVREWAVGEGAEGVLVRRVRSRQLYWAGPGDDIPLNKADILPISELTDAPARGEPTVAPGRAAYWSDRAWWSLNPHADRRERTVIGDEVDELRRLAMVGAPMNELERLGAMAATISEETEVVVVRHDPFVEGGLHLRGMTRRRTIVGTDLTVPGGEDSVSGHFWAGPPA